MKLIILGDLHLEKLSGSYFPEGDRFVYQQMDQILEYARKHGITRVIQLGDLFDRPNPDQKSVKQFIEYLYNNRDLTWDIILGNHDYSSNKSHSLEVSNFLAGAKILPNVNIHTQPLHRKEQGVDMFFAPWPHYKKFDYLKDTSCICCGHLEVSGALADSGQEIRSGISREELDKKDFWLMGHLHRRQDFGRIHYPGTALQYSFGEPLPKGFSVIEIKDSSIGTSKLEVEVKHIQLQTPYEFRNVRITKQEDFSTTDFDREDILFKIFLESRDLVVPKYLVDGSKKNIYKIVNNIPKEELTTTEQGTIIVDKEDFTLSEEFISSSKDMFFEPLEGIEEYLFKQDLDDQQVKIALDLINIHKNEFIQGR